MLRFRQIKTLHQPFVKFKSLSGSRIRMKTSYQFASLVFAALVAATPFDCQPVATVTVTLWKSISTVGDFTRANTAGSSGKVAFRNTTSTSSALSTSPLETGAPNTNIPNFPIVSGASKSPDGKLANVVTITFRKTKTVSRVSSTSGTGSIAPTTISLTVLDTTSVTLATAITPGAKINTTSYMTISISNMYGKPLSLSFTSNVNVPTPSGNPSPTVIANEASTAYAFPTGWAGRINVGPNLNPLGSKIESSYTGLPDIDVSYVDGYSVPITCSSLGVPVTGCNVELFEQQGISCANQVDGPLCLNPAQSLANGPAPPFFTACEGAAYTYPNDNLANVSNLKSTVISCCIGTSCQAPARQTRQSKVRKRRPHRYKRIASSVYRPH